MCKISLLLIFVCAVLINAQSAPSDKNIIEGIIIDSTSTSALPFANVTLHKKSDSSFVNGTASNMDGKFVLSSVDDGKYFLKISFVGYNTKYIQDISISKDKQQFNIGKIPLSKVAYELKGAEVVGEKVGEELHLDKKVINVSQNINAQGGTALDVLQNQPSVRVDPDGTVYLRGSSNFTVLVNGKPYPLQGSDALKQISANSIENIELMTNPSSKYDAEGSAGIININLKVQKDYSLSGILNLNSGTGDKYNGDFSVNYNVNGLNLTGGVDYRDNIFLNNQDLSREALLDNQYFTNSSNVMIRDKRRQYSLRAGMDYTIDNQNSMGLSLSYGNIDIIRNLTTAYSNITSAASVYSLSKNQMNLPVQFFNSTFYYQYKITPDVNDLNLEITYSNLELPSDQMTNEYNTNYDFIGINEMINSTKFYNNSKRNEGRVKLNYKQKISDITTFESGLQTNYSYRGFDVVNKIFDENIQDYMIDNLLTNNYNLRNNVYAGFVSYNSEIAGFNYMLGLRGEYMDRMLDQKTLTEKYSFEKMDYFPSVNISRKIDDHQIQFSYSRRINRPNEGMLNPFPFFSDNNISLTGNPRLKPEYINSFELNYQKMYGSVFVSVQSYYRKSMDSFSQSFSVDSTGKLNMTFSNYGNSDVYGAEISSSFSLAEIFRFDPSVNLFQTNLKGNADGVQVDKNFFNWSARINTTVSFSQSTKLQVSANYMKFVDAQSESDPFTMISASLKQELFDKKVSLTLQARNLFRASDIKINTFGSNFTAFGLIKPESPVFSLMFTYNFNNFKKMQRTNDNIDLPTGL
jgi:outer membrane receptor protein involved in Fe transport